MQENLSCDFSIRGEKCAKSYVFTNLIDAKKAQRFGVTQWEVFSREKGKAGRFVKECQRIIRGFRSTSTRGLVAQLGWASRSGGAHCWARHFSTATAAMAALSVQRLRGGIKSSARFGGHHLFEAAAQARIGGHATADREAGQSQAMHRLSCFGDQNVHHGLLKTGSEISTLLTRRRRRPGPLLDHEQHTRQRFSVR